MTITNGGIVSDRANFALGSWADYDGEGFIDLFVGASLDQYVQYQRPALYHNLGGTNFVRVGGVVELPRPYCWQGLWADLNNDGYVDLLTIGNATDWASASNRLFLGRSDHTFKWETNALGINPPIVGGFVCAPVDYDNDGALELFQTTCWVQYNSRGSLWRNRGDANFDHVWSATGPP